MTQRGPAAPRVRTVGPALLALATALCTLSLVGWARATLDGDVRRVRDAWALEAEVERLPPRLVQRGEPVPILLPASATSGSDSGCLNLAVMSSPRVAFVVQRASRRLRPVGEPEVSRAGLVELVRCGRRRSELANLWLELTTPRGVVEVVVAVGGSALTPAVELLRHRDPGLAMPDSDTGPPPISPPLQSRAKAWSELARGQGATAVSHRVLKGSPLGAVRERIELGAGCHRLAALALSRASGALGSDLDLRVFVESPEHRFLEDPAESQDASLEVCVAEPRKLAVEVAGLSMSDPGLLLLASFQFPPGLPDAWEPTLRARFAEALFARRFSGRLDEPILSMLGIAGRTRLPLVLEPRACYVLAVAVLRGEQTLLSLVAATSGTHASHVSGESALVSVCTGEDEEAALTVDALGMGLIWQLSAWRVPGEGAFH